MSVTKRVLLFLEHNLFFVFVSFLDFYMVVLHLVNLLMSGRLDFNVGPLITVPYRDWYAKKEFLR